MTRRGSEPRWRVAVTNPMSAEAAIFDDRRRLWEHLAVATIDIGPGQFENDHPRSAGHGFKNVAGQPYRMAAEISDRVREIAEARGLPESEVFERALERGLEDLWEDLVLAQYLDGELDREEAIERIGRTKVERAEREREVVEEDVDWGLNA